MSLTAVPLEFSRPFLKICKWVLFIMSLNCKLSGINGRLLTNSKMNKTSKEPSRRCNSGWKWKKLLLFLWVFLVAAGFIWFLIGGVSSQKLDHLHQLAASFFESDQITSLERTKQLELGASAKNVITCALEVPYLENNELEEHHSCAVQYVESRVENRIFSENISALGDSPISSFVKACMWAILITVLTYQIPGLYKILLKNLNRKDQKKDKVQGSSRGVGKWMKKLLILFVIAGVAILIWLYWYLNAGISLRRKETLANMCNMCDERARMLQDQFNMSMNHVHALSILVSTFYRGKESPAIDQKTFGEYTERTSFERPLTSGVAYALRVRHSERKKFEEKHGWTIKKMETEDQTLAQDCDPEKLDPSPIRDEYAPVILSQETVAHIVSIDMMSGKEDVKTYCEQGHQERGC